MPVGVPLQYVYLTNTQTAYRHSISFGGFLLDFLLFDILLCVGYTYAYVLCHVLHMCG
jgi:hypothetical protein